VNAEDAALRTIRPSAEETERILGTAEKLRGKVAEYLRERRIDADVRLVGSVAKGTFLSDPDLDLFILFPADMPRDRLVSIGLAAGEDILNGERMYAEHPYTRGVFENLDVDLVPCYALENTEKLMSAVDRTPFHTDFVLNNITETQLDHVRLLKVFAKGIGTYGAEPNTRGFSGYLCELLIIHYGSFQEVIRAGASWKDGVTISIGKRGPPMTGPMIVYDPVDPKRNVASAVHIDTLAEFIVACGSYMGDPSEKYFFPNEREPHSRKALRTLSERHGSRIITVTFAKPDTNQDNIHSQIWKTQYALEKKLNAYSFNVIRAVHELKDRITIVFELERDILSRTFKHVGPPVWVRSAGSFLEKWKDNDLGRPFVEEGQWNVIAERRHGTASEMIAEEAAIAGIGREIDPDTMEILGHDETLNDTDASLLTELLDPMHPWDV